jgi:3-hydroxy-9,10-secoandrosta-1,3,5(10)-triene-9,17-dione monooxygenase
VGRGKLSRTRASGFRVSGTWRFCSGCNHASWHFGGATIVDAQNAVPEKALFLLPISDMTFVDNWFVNGLCGTASRDGVATDAFVSEHRVLQLNDLLACETSGQRVNTAPLYRLPNATVVALGIAAPPIGATRAALSSFLGYARTRERTGGLMGDSRKMWESQVLQRRLAGASAQLDAVLALIAQVLKETQEAVRAHGLTVDTRVRVRRDLAYAVHSCVKIMGMLYESAGTEVMFPPHPLERAWRDVNAPRNTWA